MGETSIAQETIEEYINKREKEDNLEIELKLIKSKVKASKLETAKAVAELGGAVNVEIHGDPYLLKVSLIEKPIAADLAYKKKLFKAQNERCAAELCGTRLPLRSLELDHIIPQSLGGSDSLENIQLLCSWCNRVKGNRDMEYLEKRLAEAISLDLK